MPEENKTPTIRQYPLERRKIVKKFAIAMIFWGIVFLVIILATVFLVRDQGFSFALLCAEIALLAALAAAYWWYETKYFERYYYDIRPEFLVIKKGVFAPREITLPYGKLQDVYLDQDLFDRAFSIWDLHVSTATYSSGFEAHIDGVSVSNGETMKKMVLEKIMGPKK